MKREERDTFIPMPPIGRVMPEHVTRGGKSALRIGILETPADQPPRTCRNLAHGKDVN